MNSLISTSVCDDANLVSRALRGDRSCFGNLVIRHQAAVCGVAYSICGDFAASEDLAQDSFLAAWEQLPQLQEPSRFRAWVCGIVRQLSLSHVRRRTRRGDQPPAEGDPAAAVGLVAAEPSPRDTAVSDEETALLWRTLNGLPPAYREPLVLFYREQQSITAVAAALELSEDAVKQRLSRGRTMMREELAHTLESALARTRPGPGFTAMVMAALPPTIALAGALGAASTAKAATAGTGGSSAAVTTAAMLPPASLASGLTGALGLYVGYHAWRAIRMSPAFRRTFRRLVIAQILWATVALVLGAALLVAWNRTGSPEAGASQVVILLAVILGWVAVSGGLTWSGVRHMRALAAADPDAVRMPASMQSISWQSRGRFLGLPWVSIQCGVDPATGAKRGRTRAWIAIGDVACGGLVAVGSIAVAPVAIGGASVGIVSLGGLAIGGLSLGGVGFGAIALAGLGVGWTLSLGGLTVALGTACGGIAVAGHLAIGAVARAPIVGIEAWALAQADPLTAAALAVLPHTGWISLLSVPFLLWTLRRLPSANRTTHSPK